MKFTWCGKIRDTASSNSDIKMVDLDEYREMFDHNVWEYEFEIDEDKFIINN